MKKRILAMAAIAIAVATTSKLSDEDISKIANALNLSKDSVHEMADEVVRAQHFAEADMQLAE